MSLTPSQVVLIKAHAEIENATEILDLLAQSKQPALEDKLTCQICTTPYYSPNDVGRIETPCVTPCGHYFGDSCIDLYIAKKCEDAEEEDEEAKPECPSCRFPMYMKTCGHPIAPHPAFRTNNPAFILPEERPDKCSECERRKLNQWYRNSLDESEKLAKKLRQETRKASDVLFSDDFDSVFQLDPALNQDFSLNRRAIVNPTLEKLFNLISDLSTHRNNGKKLHAEYISNKAKTARELKEKKDIIKKKLGDFASWAISWPADKHSCAAEILGRVEAIQEGDD